MITYVVPAYNAEKTIGKCVDSILVQKGKKQVIVIDDDSTDRTREILESFNDKILYASEHENRGPGACRNDGLQLAKGKHIAFIDSDVVLPKDWSEKALKLLVNIKNNVVGVNGPGKSPIKGSLIAQSLNALLYGKGGSEKSMFVDSIATMDALYKSEAIKGLKFKEGVKSGEDCPFNFVLRRKGYKLLYTTRLWVWHYHPENFSQLTKKWRKYGKNYLWPYQENNDFVNKGVWVRASFLPVMIWSSLIGFLHPLFWLISLAQLGGMFGVYALKGLKLCKGKLRIVFPFIHTYKQLVQVVSIWV